MKRALTFLIVCVIAVVSAVVFVRTFTGAVIGSAPPDSVMASVLSPIPSAAPAGTSASGPSPATETGYVKKAVVIPLSYPSRFLIPALNIDAAVQDAGITAKGAIGSPSNFTDVAWYEYGTVPGDNGNAVIDGHVDNGLALAGVFKHLGDITAGDHVYITTHGGKRLDFIVTSVDTYDYQHVPIDAILSATSSPQISLITCEGTWVAGEKTYDERLVVTATLQN